MKKKIKTEFTFRKNAWREFKKNKAALCSVYILFFLVFISVFSPFIANNQPLYLKYSGQKFYPAFQTLFNSSYSSKVTNPQSGIEEELVFKLVDWRQLNLESVIWPLIPYSPEQFDKYNTDFIGPSDNQQYKPNEGMKDSPWIFRHHLGTDGLGRDVASGLIHGTRISLSVGMLSMSIAGFLGVFLGALAGYYGDTQYKVTRLRKILIYFGVFLGFYYGFFVRSSTISQSFSDGVFDGFMDFTFSLIIMALFITFFSLIGRIIKIGGFLNVEVPLKIDYYVSRSIEVLNSLPTLLLIITIAAIMQQRSLVMLMIIIGLTSWTGIARFTRAEFLRLRELEFIHAAKVLGFSDWRIIFKHALPNGLAPIFVSIAFGVASAILAESSLSFLGIGVPEDIVTWGSLLSIGKEEFDAWWLVVFPGFAIFITIMIYNLIGEGLRDALDPKYHK
jgi:peptide/nickel transport system permease protein